jgi:hypothetical protein
VGANAMKIAGLDPVFYEFFNLTIASLATMLTSLVVRYLSIEHADGRFMADRVYRRESMLIHHQFALALGAIAFGEACNRWWTFWARFSDNMGLNVGWMSDWEILPRSTVVILVVGFLCSVKVLTPQEYGRRAWVKCAALTLAINVMVISVHVAQDGWCWLFWWC